MSIVGSLAILMFGIAGYFAWMGLWLVFPFSGFELLLLCYCLYLRTRANCSQEVITFSEDTVLVERGCFKIEHRWQYPRLWAKIFVKPPRYYGDPKRVYIRSHGDQLELGAFLNKREKQKLIKDLKHIVYG